MYQKGEKVKIKPINKDKRGFAKRKAPFLAHIVQVLPNQIIVDNGLYKQSISTDGIDYEIEVLSDETIN
jgi:hypothetical protein